MTQDYSLETSRRVWDASEGVSIEVRPSPDNPNDYTEVHTTHCEASKEYFGELLIVLPNPMAKLLGQALIAQTDRQQK